VSVPVPMSVALPSAGPKQPLAPTSPSGEVIRDPKRAAEFVRAHREKIFRCCVAGSKQSAVAVSGCKAILVGLTLIRVFM
jgi:hypothetical protein